MIRLSLSESAWGDVDPGTEALLDRWLVAVGDRVRAGQAVAEAVLVKTNYEITAPEDGVLAEILVQESDTFGRDTPIGLLQPDSAAAEPPTEELPVTAAQPAAAIRAGPQILPLTGLRGSVARAMSLAWQAPQVAMGVDVDMTRCLARRDALRAEHGDARLTITPLIIRAAALALRAHPRMNAHLTERGVELHEVVHIALAVSLDEGLLTPVIRDADRLSSVEIGQQAQQLAEAARANTLPPSALQGGTFSVTNLGMAGIDWFTPVLNPPQVGILGIGRLAQQAAVRDGAVVAVPTLTLTLVFDHRAIDGYPAALFLADVRARLEEAAEL
jgi:pyruvate/2-oxoglutarate dehydrogenase complex dihydrolipoamide acyltransferase (E2) component